jgi:hypothetical protein
VNLHSATLTLTVWLLFDPHCLDEADDDFEFYTIFELRRVTPLGGPKAQSWCNIRNRAR